MLAGIGQRARRARSCYASMTLAMLRADREQTRAPPRGSSTCWHRPRAPTSRSSSRRSEPTETRVSVRTTDRADAVAITSAFGGGGHARAAGCTVDRAARGRAGRGPGRVPSASWIAAMLGVVNLDKPVGADLARHGRPPAPADRDATDRPRRHARPARVRRAAHPGRRGDPLQRGAVGRRASATTRDIRLGQQLGTDDARGSDHRRRRAAAWRGADRRGARNIRRHVRAAAAAFSARKVGRRTAYRAARAGKPIELQPRQRHGRHASTVLDISPATGGWTSDRLRCGPGTYVRSIARDLGERLGCGGHLAPCAAPRPPGCGSRTPSRRSSSGAAPARVAWPRPSCRWRRCCRCRG